MGRNLVTLTVLLWCVAVILFATGVAKGQTPSVRDVQFAQTWQRTANAAHTWQPRSIRMSLARCKKGTVDYLCIALLSAPRQVAACVEAKVTPTLRVVEWSWFPCSFVSGAFV